MVEVTKSDVPSGERWLRRGCGKCKGRLAGLGERMQRLDQSEEITVPNASSNNGVARVSDGDSRFGEDDVEALLKEATDRDQVDRKTRAIESAV